MSRRFQTPPAATSTDLSDRRASIVLAVIVFWMAVICVRLAYLQTTEAKHLTALARQQQQKHLVIDAPRGLIKDRSGQILAQSVETYSFALDPSKIPDAKAAETISSLATLLSQTLGGDAEATKQDLIKRVTEAREKGRQFIWLVRKVDEGSAVKINNLIAAKQLKGVIPHIEAKREYANGSLAAHILGYVGDENKGLAGIEQYLNTDLSGDDGELTTEVLMEGAKARPYGSEGELPESGKNVYLSLDQNIQLFVEKRLAEAIRQTGAKGGTAIVLDPRTGETLALANAPGFDVNDFSKVEPELRTNRALQTIYEPGSTFKIVPYAAALEEGLAQPNELINCQGGSITVAGTVINDSHPYGTMTLTDALAKSSNVAAIKLGLRLKSERLMEYITRFGFGAKTGFEGSGETKGILRPLSEWGGPDIGYISIGQSIGVTPLQVAGAFAAIANDGVRLPPHVVREIRSTDDQVLLSQPRPEGRRVVSINTARTLRRMLESVTLRGTAKQAQLESYRAAGKTGTAQKIDPRTGAYSQTKYVASFAGFAPLDNPAVVVVVLLDEPKGAAHQGGAVAAPVFRDIAEYVLPYLSVAPDGVGYTKPPTDSPASVDGAKLEKRVVAAAIGKNGSIKVPDFSGLSVREVSNICLSLNLQLQAMGDGTARTQSPRPGTRLTTGESVKVEFGQ